MSDWPKGPLAWIEDRHLYVSVPFTWNLNEVRTKVSQASMFWDHATVGGPAVKLSRGFSSPFRWPSGVTVDYGDMPGVLQRANPLATRTSTGCPNSCAFCGVSKIEPGFSELIDWDNKPIICDNNFLGCSKSHRAIVYERLADLRLPAGVVDFNQGLDAFLMTDWDAVWLNRLKATCRFSCDAVDDLSIGRAAFGLLRSAGNAKARITIYALIGWRDTPKEAWERCDELASWGILCCPMWFHKLDAMEWNIVTEEQEALGWTNQKRLDIMGWFWQRRGDIKEIRKTISERRP
jgi:hypothetical protein